jgi:outer membrane protein
VKILLTVPYAASALLGFFMPSEAIGQMLSIPDAIQIALRQNETVLYASEASYSIAQTQLRGVEATYNPTLNASFALVRFYTRTKLLTGENVDLGFDYSRSQQMLPSFSLGQTFLTPFGSRLFASAGMQTSLHGFSSLEYQTSPAFSLSLQQPLSPSGINSGHADLIRANQSCRQAEISYQLQRQQFVLMVIQAYFLLWQSFRSIEQSEREVASTKRVLEVAELKLKAGSISEFEALNLRVQYRLAEDNLLQARNAARTQTLSFRRLLGENVDEDRNVALSSEIPVDSITFELPEAKSRALTTRLELQQAMIALEGAELGKEIAASSVSPTLTFNALYNLNSLSEPTFIKSLTDMPNYTWSIQATVSVPILDGGKTTAQVEIAERSISIQEKNINLLKEEITLDVENRYRTLELNGRRLSSLRLSLEAATEALKIAEMRFQSGQISSTEIENVRNRYTAAQNALNGARISYVLERAALAMAMGELFEWVETLWDR